MEGAIKKKPYNLIGIALLILVMAALLCSCTRTVTLYFAAMQDNDVYLVPETRKIDASSDIYLETARQLVAGPQNDRLYPTIPSDATVNSVDVSGGLAIVDFDIRIISNFEEIPHSSTTEMLAIYSIVNTLTGFDGIDRVRITVEGTRSGQVDGINVEDFWGHIGIYEDFARDEEIIKDE